MITLINNITKNKLKEPNKLKELNKTQQTLWNITEFFREVKSLILKYKKTYKHINKCQFLG
jgi:hypothetical protein